MSAREPLRTLIGDLWSEGRGRFVALVLLMCATSIAEGSGVASLVPLLMLLGTGPASPDNRVAAAFSAVLGSLHLPPQPWAVALLAFALFATQYVLLIAQSWLLGRALAGHLGAIRQRLFAAVITARWSFFTSNKVAEMQNAILNESYRVYVAAGMLLQQIAAAASAAVYLALSLVLSVKLTLAMVALGLAIGAVTHRLARRSRELGATFSRTTEDQMGWTGEVLNGAKLVKATGAEEFVRVRFDAINEQLGAYYRWAHFHPGLIRSVVEMTAVLSLVIALLFARQALDLDTATLLVVLGIFARLYPRLSTLQGNWHGLQLNLPAVEYVDAFHRRAAAARETHPEAVDAPPPSGPLELEVRDVTVRYGETTALASVSLVAQRGRVTAIVGQSGAGKTTLMDCLLELVVPDAGQILMDGVPLKSLSLRSLRARVGYVGQETILFNATVRQNIVWNHPEAGEDAVHEAARRANAHEFVAALPQGYDTPVGDRGVRLSGGQRQRLGLARALVGGRPLLILDEATSALDSASEAEVLAAIDRLAGSVTIVAVAHRLATIKNAHHIYVLDGGRVVEDGTWSALLERRGSFHRLWNMQSHAPDA